MGGGVFVRVEGVLERVDGGGGVFVRVEGVLERV